MAIPSSFLRMCICFLTSICIGTILCAQDRIITLSGKYLEVSITDDSGANIFFDVTKTKGKTRSLSIYKGDVFSTKRQGETETLLYAQDVDFGYELSVEDMRHYIFGQHDAREGYDATPSLLAGFAVGVGSALYLESGFLPLTVPIIYSLGMQIPYIKIKEKTISDLAYKGNPNYKYGYEKTARSKKMIRSMLGSAVGVLVGITIYEVSN